MKPDIATGFIPAAAYARYSSELQYEMSIQGQPDIIQAFAASRSGKLRSVQGKKRHRCFT